MHIPYYLSGTPVYPTSLCGCLTCQNLGPFEGCTPVRKEGVFNHAGPLSKEGVKTGHFKALLFRQHAKARKRSHPEGPSSEEWTQDQGSWPARDKSMGMSRPDILSAPTVSLLPNCAHGRTNSQSVNRVSVYTAYSETPAVKGEDACSPWTQIPAGGYPKLCHSRETLSRGYPKLCHSWTTRKPCPGGYPKLRHTLEASFGDPTPAWD